MAVIPLLRQGILGVTTLFSLIELAIAAHLIAQTQQYFGFTATFCALGVAVAAISLVTLPVMLVVDILRQGAFSSMIVVEVAWLSILCILWVATAGETTSEYNGVFPFGCDFVDPVFNALLYAIGLTVLALIAANRGQGVWLSSVKESFGSSGGPVQYPMSQHQIPPQSQVVSSHTTGATQPGAVQDAPGHALV